MFPWLQVLKLPRFLSNLLDLPLQVPHVHLNLVLEDELDVREQDLLLLPLRVVLLLVLRRPLLAAELRHLVQVDRSIDEDADLEVRHRPENGVQVLQDQGD